ncbi:MAG TPA: hypothetical protein DCF63_07600 [Planctomycetaceae bacterium]|nr:hypothetical protein [Planctomycetaceae bacterium]
MSRNAYRDLLINARGVMFIDIDVASTIHKPGFWARLRSGTVSTIWRALRYNVLDEIESNWLDPQSHLLN